MGHHRALLLPKVSDTDTTSVQERPGPGEQRRLQQDLLPGTRLKAALPTGPRGGEELLQLHLPGDEPSAPASFRAN